MKPKGLRILLDCRYPAHLYLHPNRHHHQLFVSAWSWPNAIVIAADFVERFAPSSKYFSGHHSYLPHRPLLLSRFLHYRLHLPPDRKVGSPTFHPLHLFGLWVLRPWWQISFVLGYHHLPLLGRQHSRYLWSRLRHPDWDYLTTQLGICFRRHFPFFDIFIIFKFLF